MPDLLLSTLRLPLSPQETVANLTGLGRDFVADFAVAVADFAAVALAAMLDATVDSEFSTQPTVQRIVVDPSHAGPAATFLTQASELSHVAAQPELQYQSINAPVP